MLGCAFMVELSASPRHQDFFERRYGGDTLNTAVYLARLLGGSGINVGYATRLGDDRLSRWMLDGWKSEGIDCSLVQIVEGCLPGLYMISARSGLVRVSAAPNSSGSSSSFAG